MAPFRAQQVGRWVVPQRRQALLATEPAVEGLAQLLQRRCEAIAPASIGAAVGGRVRPIRI